MTLPPGSPVPSTRRAPIQALDLEEGPELREYFSTLLQHRWLIGGVLVLCVAAAYGYLVSATPLYRARVLVMIERTGPHVIDIASVDGESLQLGTSEDYYRTQHVLLASRTLAQHVIDTLDLHDAQRFLGQPRGLRAWLHSFFGSQPQEASPEQAQATVNAYLKELDIEPIRDSRLVWVGFDASDPELAAQIANEHARAFIRQGFANRDRASSEAGVFLRASTDELQDRVTEAQNALNAFRREHDIVALEDERSDLITANLEDMNKRLVQAQADKIALEADMRLVRKRDYETLAPVLQSELIQRLKQELAPLEREYASMRQSVTEEYSGMKVLRSRIEEARSRLDREIQKIVEGIESGYLAAVDREQELRQQVEKRKAEALALKEDGVEYAMLQQNLQSAMELYESVRRRSEETTMVAALPTTNISVVDAAYAPSGPVYPRKTQVLALSGMLGLLLGGGLALLRELLDNRIRSPLELERQLRLPALGMVPDFSRISSGRRRLLPHPAGLRRIRELWHRKRSADPDDFAESAQVVSIEEPGERVREAYRAIRTDLLLSQAGEPPQCILFTSAAEGEGKTTTALNTAVLFAQLAGGSVLLLDADLRKPRCHQILRRPREPGLTESLTGGAPAIHRVPVLERELCLLSSGVRPPNPTELLAPSRMRELLGKLREQFDHVLIDGPPVAPVSDALVLSSMVDGVVLIADRRRTPRPLLKLAHSRLRQANAKVLGVILNRVDPAENTYSPMMHGYDS